MACSNRKYPVKTSCQFRTCPFPINFDTYKGCSHACKYCFANNTNFSKKTINAEKVITTGGVKELEDWAAGKRSALESWCDWNIPVCWGRMTDPFQPCELKYGRSLECLKWFAKTGYPFIVTTKSVLCAENEEYYSVLKDCNCVFQMSMCCSRLDPLETGAPSYERRLSALEKIAKAVQRLIVRWQPFFNEYLKDALLTVPRVAETGAYGILVGAAYLKKPTKLCNEFYGGVYHYPVSLTEKSYLQIRASCHAHGLVFLADDLRRLSDAMPCCTGDTTNLKGFRPCKCNAVYYWLKRDEFEVTPRMREAGSGAVFHNIYYQRDDYSKLKTRSFADMMRQAVTQPDMKDSMLRG